jgi:hypothetical protein
MLTSITTQSCKLHYSVVTSVPGCSSNIRAAQVFKRWPDVTGTINRRPSPKPPQQLSRR